MAQARVKAKKKPAKKKPLKRAIKKAVSKAKRAVAKATGKPLISSEADVQAAQRRMLQILSTLKREYPDAHCSLNHESAFQLLMATILSAQCTDERVNLVTPELFRRYPGPREMAAAPIQEIERLVQSTGFFRQKAKSLQQTSRELVEKHGGQVPNELEKLVTLRGVGRKTANVILGNAYGIPGLVVDTHVGRISRRMAFTAADDPVKVELEMMRIVPREDWTLYAHLLIDHGRAVCTARRAFCSRCPISGLCPKVGVVDPG